MKIFNNSKEKKEINNLMKSTSSIIKDFVDSIPSLIENQKKRNAEERSKDFKALILTVIIISILLFIFWKVPFLKNFLFP